MKATDPSASRSNIPDFAIELRDIAKRFGDCIANHSINLKVAGGTIHGIIGENGAGKSTAMKILYGMIRPDQGEILVQGESVRFSSPADAIAHGIGMVHQHFMLAGPHTALDNILFGSGAPALRNNSTKKQRGQNSPRNSPAIMESIRTWTKRSRILPVGIQQKTEILKLLYRKANILILDEPTAVLTAAGNGGTSSPTSGNFKQEGKNDSADRVTKPERNSRDHRQRNRVSRGACRGFCKTADE